MLKHLYPIFLLVLAGHAGAAVRASTPIVEVQDCPGFGRNYLYTVIPHVSTKTDDSGDPLELSLIVKDWRTPNQNTNVMRICALSQSGQFMGGSVLEFTNGSRLSIQRSTGTEGWGLEQIVAATTSDLSDKVFQLYVGIGGNNSGTEPQLEFGQTGNQGQYVVRAFARGGIETFTAMYDSNNSPFKTTYHVANSSAGTQNCDIEVRYFDDDGARLVTTTVPVAPRSSVSIDPELTLKLSYSSIAINRGGCSPIHVMRVVDYPSGAIGGHSAVMTSR